MRKYFKILILSIFILPCILIASCGTINVAGKTFKYGGVAIDWGTATDENKNAIYTEYQVESDTELLNVFKTRNNRNNRVTTFGTDGKYTTKNEDNEILDSGFYRQNETQILLAETKEGLDEDTAYTLTANNKGYIVTIELNSETQTYIKYQYVVMN